MARKDLAVDRLRTHRFSDPPRLEDLDQLFVDQEDLADLRRCRPGDCGLKLSDAEIAIMRQVIENAGSAWTAAAQQAFREIVLERATAYLAEGHSASAVYHDERKPVLLDAEFAAIASEIALRQPRLFPLANFLALYPNGDLEGVESFLYWSKESLGAKPIVSVTHVAIVESPDAREAIVAKKQVYASHYITGSLSFTAISAPNDSDRYLMYLNHSRSDVLDGLFGGLIRRVIQRRLRAEGPGALQTLRRRIESGGS